MNDLSLQRIETRRYYSPTTTIIIEETPEIVLCILKKDKETFRKLVANKVGLCTPDIDGNLPIHHAAKIGSLKFVRVLCNFNPVAKKNIWGQTSLHIAAFEGHLKVVQELSSYKDILTFEADWKFGKNKLKVTPLSLAIIAGRKDCIDILLKKNAHLTTFRSNIGTLIHTAIFFQQNKVLKHLLEAYPNHFTLQLNEKNSVGQTPLMLAAFLGNLEAILILEQHDVDINSTDGGNTALHWAVEGNQGNSVSLLLSLGAAEHLLDHDNDTPLSLAKSLIPEFGEDMRYIEAILSNHIRLDKSGLNYIDYPPENLVLQGGGPKGGGLIGAIKELERSGLLKNLKRVAGTSAGSIAAGLLAVGHKADRIEQINYDIDLTKLLDVDMSIDFLGVVENLAALVNIYFQPSKAMDHLLSSFFAKMLRCTGICHGELFLNKIEELIKEKTEKDFFTLKDLREKVESGDKSFKHFYAPATKINGIVEILDLNSEDGKFDNVPLSHAIFGSMCIPMLFKPFTIYEYKEGQKIEHKVVDGGLLNNLNVERFDRQKYTKTHLNEAPNYPVFNKRTLAISFQESQADLSSKPVYTGMDNILDFLVGMFSVYAGAESLIRKLNPYNESRLIRVDSCGVKLWHFDLPLEAKEKIVQAGIEAVKTFKAEQRACFNKPVEIENITEKMVPMLVGDKPGVYIFIDEWIYCENILGNSIQLNTYLKKHPIFHTSDAPFLKIAFCGCQGSIRITTHDENPLKEISQPQGKSQVFEILKWKNIIIEAKEAK